MIALCMCRTIKWIVSLSAAIRYKAIPESATYAPKRRSPNEDSAQIMYPLPKHRRISVHSVTWDTPIFLNRHLPKITIRGHENENTAIQPCHSVSTNQSFAYVYSNSTASFFVTSLVFSLSARYRAHRESGRASEHSINAVAIIRSIETFFIMNPNGACQGHAIFASPMHTYAINLYLMITSTLFE
jgi:hypothetical protein